MVVSLSVAFFLIKPGPGGHPLMGHPMLMHPGMMGGGHHTSLDDEIKIVSEIIAGMMGGGHHTSLDDEIKILSEIIDKQEQLFKVIDVPIVVIVYI